MVQGERISKLRFADDIFLSAQNKVELKKVMNGIKILLREEFGLRINKNKTNAIKICKNGR